MDAAARETLNALAADLQEGRHAAPETLAHLLRIEERSLRRVSYRAYPLTAPEQAVQFAMRDLVEAVERGMGLVSRHREEGRDEEDFLWRLISSRNA